MTWFIDFVTTSASLVASTIAIVGAGITVRRQFPALWDKFILAKRTDITVTAPFSYSDVQLGMSELVDNVSRFRPDIIIGVNRGGAIVGGILGKHLNKYVH